MTMKSDNVISTLNKSLTSELDDDVFSDFTFRIQTFIDGQKWIKKPVSLSPSICSQYGWKCIRSDLLECVACGAKLSIYEPKAGHYDNYKVCVEKSLNDLKNNHGKHCPWPLTPSPGSFVKMIVMPKEEALSQFLKRVELSLCFQSSFPKIKDSVIKDLGFDEKQVMHLCKLAKMTTEEASQFGMSIIPLSATGWIITQEHETRKCVLKCNNCLRSVWCGSFSLHQSEDFKIEDTQSNCGNDDRISSTSSDNGNESGEPPLKRKRSSLVIKKGEPFDPLHEHRPWCLWIHDGLEDYTSIPCKNGSSEALKPTSGVPGWKIFVKSLLKNIPNTENLAEKNSPSREQIRNVRNLVEKWTEVV